MISRVIILVTACTVSAIIGSLLSRGTSWKDKGTVTEADDSKPATSLSNRAEATRAERRAESESTVQTRSPAQLLALKNELKEILSMGPAPEFDWAARGKVASLLATMSPAELEGFASEMFMAEQGREAEGDDWRNVMMSEIFRQWSLKDPAGASLGLPDNPLAKGGEAFNDWLRRDPEAAKAWLNNGPFPDGTEKRIQTLRKALLEHEADRDLPAAAASLAGFEPDARKTTLLEWSRKMALDPDKRSQLLQFVSTLGDPELEAKCHETLIREMAVKSPWEASQFLENNPDLTEDQKHKFNEQVLGQWAVQKPQEAFAKWAELKEEKAPKFLFEAFADWSLNSPGAEQAIEWTKGLHPGPAREVFKTRLITGMASGERYQQAADLSATLDDPAERLRQMKIVKRAWEEKFPGSAEQWYAKLPQADKDALEKEID